MTHSKRKDTDSWDPRKTFIFICSVAHVGLFFSSFSSVAEVVHLILLLILFTFLKIFNHTFFFYFIYLCHYIGLLQFCGDFLFCLLDCFPYYSFPAIVII